MLCFGKVCQAGSWEAQVGQVTHLTGHCSTAQLAFGPQTDLEGRRQMERHKQTLQAQACAHIHSSIHTHIKALHSCTHSIKQKCWVPVMFYVLRFAAWYRLYFNEAEAQSLNLFFWQKIFLLTIKLHVSVIINQRWSSGVSPCVVPGFAFFFLINILSFGWRFCLGLNLSTVSSCLWVSVLLLEQGS